jgi:hypothetical protein
LVDDARRDTEVRFFLGLGCVVHGVFVIMTGQVARGLSMFLGDERYVYGGSFVIFGAVLIVMAIRDQLKRG